VVGWRWRWKDSSRNSSPLFYATYVKHNQAEDYSLSTRLNKLYL